MANENWDAEMKRYNELRGIIERARLHAEHPEATKRALAAIEAGAELQTMALCSDDELHGWFGLSYASYLVVPRTLLQSMPAWWKEAMAVLLHMADQTLPTWPENATPQVQLRSDSGLRVKDPLQDYQRGRRRVPLKPVGNLPEVDEATGRAALKAGVPGAAAPALAIQSHRREGDRRNVQQESA